MPKKSPEEERCRRVLLFGMPRGVSEEETINIFIEYLMKTLLIIATSIIIGYLLGIASFKDGYDKQAYSLQWDWGMGEDISSDCLFFRKKVDDHSTERTPVFCVKNSFRK